MRQWRRQAFTKRETSVRERDAFRLFRFSRRFYAVQRGLQGWRWHRWLLAADRPRVARARMREFHALKNRRGGKNCATIVYLALAARDDFSLIVRVMIARSTGRGESRRATETPLSALSQHPYPASLPAPARYIRTLCRPSMRDSLSASSYSLYPWRYPLLLPHHRHHHHRCRHRHRHRHHHHHHHLPFLLPRVTLLLLFFFQGAELYPAIFADCLLAITDFKLFLTISEYDAIRFSRAALLPAIMIITSVNTAHSRHSRYCFNIDIWKPISNTKYGRTWDVA